MSNKRIRTVIFLGILAILSVLIIQIISIQENLQFQRTNIQIQNRQDSLNSAQFNDKVVIALKKVAEDITKLNQSEVTMYGNVLQRTPNYFTVEMQDTVHPALLQRLLKWEFDEKNLQEDFQFGIYDCWSDSIIYGNYMKYEQDSIYVIDNSYVYDAKIDEAELKLNTDLHYFGVMFPARGHPKLHDMPSAITPWVYVIAIIFFVFIFFAFAVSIIVRQKKLSEVKNDFINNMTHELKTPIATIRISAESLLNFDENADMDKRLRYAGIIYKENKRLEQQVERVLNVAKLDKKELKFKIEAFDIHEIIEEAKENFEFSQIEEREGQISMNLTATDYVVRADQVHVTNVIHNLLDNAIKYCEGKPSIHIETRNHKGKFQVSIKDNGKGISKENLKYIFDKFYRVPTGNLHDVKGFGLGLYYVKTILEELGGSIAVKSNLGKGSEFTVTLPINEQ